MWCALGCCNSICAPTALVAGATALFTQRERVFRYVKQNWLKLLIFVVIPIAAAYAALHLGYVEAPKVDYESIPYVKEVMTMAGFNDESKAAVAVVDTQPEVVAATPEPANTSAPPKSGGCGCCPHSKP